MECSSCHFVNTSSAKFCAGCGAALQTGCHQCGATMLAGAKFCQECGVALSDTPIAGAAPARANPAPAKTPTANAVLPSDVPTAWPTSLGLEAVETNFASAPTTPGFGEMPAKPNLPTSTVGTAITETSSGGVSIERVLKRMWRAVLLERSVYEEVQFDSSAGSDALVAVSIVALAAGIGAVLANPRGGPVLFFAEAIAILVGWYVWAYLTYFIGVRFFGGRATPDELRRTMAFAYAPGVVVLLTFLPVVGPATGAAAAIWDIVTGVVAVRTALDFDTDKAVLTVVGAIIVAFVAVVLVVVILGLLVGALLFAGSRGF